ncbi:antitermination protein, partial [Escherichia coli]|uniref:antitermination protein Q n=1 Tax=Escherichia coli TaxID=562 RepID=UPI0029161738
KTSIFSHPVYLFLRKFSLQDSRGGSPSTEAFNAICNVTDAISLDTWKKTVKRFYDTLVVQFDIEEAWAEQQLKKVTR